MAHFAQIIDSIVSQVIVAEQDFIDSLPESEHWVQTSYNTRGGLHYGPDGAPDGGEPLRFNFAGVGYAYDAERDAFIPPQPYPSWTLDPATCLWAAPLPMPDNGGAYLWDERAQVWVPWVAEEGE